MFSEVHKQRPRADDFFGNKPQCSNQPDVSLASTSDLETHIYIYIIHTLSIALYNGLILLLLLCDQYNPIVCCCIQETMLTEVVLIVFI